MQQGHRSSSSILESFALTTTTTDSRHDRETPRAHFAPRLTSTNPTVSGILFLRFDGRPTDRSPSLSALSFVAAVNSLFQFAFHYTPILQYICRFISPRDFQSSVKKRSKDRQSSILSLIGEKLNVLSMASSRFVVTIPFRGTSSNRAGNIRGDHRTVRSSLLFRAIIPLTCRLHAHRTRNPRKIVSTFFTDRVSKGRTDAAIRVPRLFSRIHSRKIFKA